MSDTVFYVLVVALCTYLLGVAIVLGALWSGREFREYRTIGNGMSWWAAIPMALAWPLLLEEALTNR